MGCNVFINFATFNGLDRGSKQNLVHVINNRYICGVIGLFVFVQDR
jgi:hypothetical protein